MTAASCLICRQHGGQVDVPGGVLDDGLTRTYHLPPQDTVYAGHLLVTPARHAPDFAALGPDEAAAVGVAIGAYSRALKTLGAVRVYVVTIGHNVDHLHVHLMPRWPSTPADVAWHSVDEWDGARQLDAAGVVELMAAIRTA